MPPNSSIGEPVAVVVGAVRVQRDVRDAQRPVEVARRDEVDRVAGLGEAARGEARDVVVDVVAVRVGVVDPAEGDLRVRAERRRRADADDVRVGCRRADRAGDPGVAGAHDDGDARRDRGVVGFDG